jgi:phosphoribosylformylglycinamidine cyclo-ligase
MSSDTSKICASGVSASKEDVHNAIKTLIKLFQAFCKIVPDYLTQDERVLFDYAR